MDEAATTPMQKTFLIVLVPLLFLGSVATDGQQRNEHRKLSLQRRLQVADSLRQQLRKAADEGRMLQWGDSLLRDRLSKNIIDSVKYMRLRRRLVRADKHLHRGDSLLQHNYNKLSYDTLYIGRPDTRWTVKLRGNLSGAKIEATGYREQTRYHSTLRADYRGTMSIAVAYRGIAAGIAINPAKLAGKSKDNEFNLNSYSNRYGFDVVYLSSTTYHGQVDDGDDKLTLSKGKVRQKALNLNLYYAFNGRRFSFPASFSQSYIQKRSAGSLMAGLSLDAQTTEVNDESSALLKNSRLRLVELGVGVGYGYNLVVGRHWLFHLSTLPTFDVFIKSHISKDGLRMNMDYKFPSVIITGRGAAVYSWKNKFTGLTMVLNFSAVGDEQQLQVKRDKWRLRLFYGFRF